MLNYSQKLKNLFKEVLKKVFPQGVTKNFLIALMIFVFPILILMVLPSKVNTIIPVFELREILTRVLASYFFARSDLPTLILGAFKKVFKDYKTKFIALLTIVGMAHKKAESTA